MGPSKNPRSAHKAATKHEAIFSLPLPPAPPSLPPVTATTTTTCALTGTKRRRDDPEDEGDEDAFYGRRSAKSRSNGVKTFERRDIGQNKKESDGRKGQVTPARTPATKGPGKRLRFDPEIHGVLTLPKKDSFEGMVTPRKKVSKDTDKVGEKDKTGAKYWEALECIQTSNILRRIAALKIAKPKKPILATQTESPNDKGTTANKSIAASIPTNSAHERELSRPIYPASNRAQISQPHTANSSFSDSTAPIKLSKALTRPSFELSGDAYMKKRVTQREERKKRMEEAERQKEEARKQQQLQERFKIHTKKNSAKKDQQQGPAPASSRAPTAQNPNLFSSPSTKIAMTTVSEPGSLGSSNSSRLTLDEASQQLHNESELERKKAEEAVLRTRQEAAEKGKESARLWAEQMKSKVAMFSNDETS